MKEKKERENCKHKVYGYLLLKNKYVMTDIIARDLDYATSTVRRALKELLDENKVFYVYLISYGKVMAFYTAKTKVSSLNSYLNPMNKIVRVTVESTVTVDSADIDGSYGENADGVFFFTTEGAYVEWKGEYMVSDYPLKLSTPPELVRNI